MASSRWFARNLHPTVAPERLRIEIQCRQRRPYVRADGTLEYPRLPTFHHEYAKFGASVDMKAQVSVKAVSKKRPIRLWCASICILTPEYQACHSTEKLKTEASMRRVFSADPRTFRQTALHASSTKSDSYGTISMQATQSSYQPDSAELGQISIGSPRTVSAVPEYRVNLTQQCWHPRRPLGSMYSFFNTHSNH
jgi:hypothetical protein